jgi:uncharacterized protein RhaS with RHS repeats
VLNGAGRIGYLNNRYYDPQTGIFLAVDPLVAQTGDPYLYAAGNPTTFSDPTGLAACKDEGNCGYLRDKTWTSHDRYIDLLWRAKARADRHAADEIRNAYGDPADWGNEASVLRFDQQRLANDYFVEIIGREIAGFKDTGNGVFLRPEDASDWEGHPDRNGSRTYLGPTGWRPDLVDDDSPEGHLTGYAALAFLYGEAQTTAGLRIAESGAPGNGASQQDYDLGLIGIRAGAKLDGTATIVDVISFLDTSTRGSWSSEEHPPGLAPNRTTTPSLIGSLPCYLGLTC